ncbi:MAG: CDP-alcohol phosphatidyltransferase family protein [Kofleriaceae bacterium]
MRAVCSPLTTVDRIYLLAPALVLLAIFSLGFVVYCARCAVGRAPELQSVKHNQLIGPFLSGFLVWLLGPFERVLVGRVSPNAITALSLAMCAASGLALGLGHLAVGIWLYVFAGILDVLDGRIARLSNHQTASGALFDSVSDRWGELFVFAGFGWYLHHTHWLLAVMLAIGASMMVSYTRARAEGLGIELSGGMMQRAERIVLVTVGTLVAAWYGAEPETASIAVPIIGGTMVVLGVASAATAINRWVVAYRTLVARPQNVAVEPQELAQPAVELPAATPQYPRVRKVVTLHPHH